MKRFQFRLQSVLEHRQRKETLAHLNFGQAQTELFAARAMLQDLEEGRDSLICELSERRMSGQFDPNESRIYDEYLQTIKKCLVEQNAFVADLTTTVEALRLNLVGASQDRQVLDHMKGKARANHQSESLKTEQNASDDLSSARRHYHSAQLGHE